MHQLAKTNHTLAVAVLFLWTLGIRAALLGQAPFADEGHYAAASYFQFLGYTQGVFAENSIIPNFGIIEIYSLLFSWVYLLPINGYISLRVIDAVIAGLTTIMMFKYLYIVSRQQLAACLAALLLATAINHPLFIEAGARNPIPAATCLLFCSLYLLERQRGKKLLPAALCLAGAVLVREPFVAIAGVVVLHVFHQYKLRSAVLFSLYGLAGCLAGFLLVGLLKGGLAGISTNFLSYFQFTQLDASVNLDFRARLALAASQAAEMSTALGFCLPIVLLGLLAPLLTPALRTPRALAPYWLGIGIALASLLEAAIKKPYPYHLAQFLIGLGIFACYGFQILIAWIRAIRQSSPAAALLCVTAVFVGHGLLATDYARVLRYAAAWTIHFAPVMIFNDWNSPVVKDSYFLSVASIVKNNSRQDDVILSTFYNVYPLTHRLPPNRDIASVAVFQRQQASESANRSIIQIINEQQPAVFIQEVSELQRLRPATGPVEIAVAANYSSAVDVGPGLFPYRKFSAKVHLHALPH
ncbi:hypothetical protein [Roseateles sp.]|uniref:hypothetical protein n=1 Tax=Roseateles sp. TaxID=1971397 RepID=UPI00286CFB08|nr:hypothetical protein [Roseateles sp.]